MTDIRLDDVLDSTLEWDGGDELVRVHHTPRVQGVSVSTTPPSAGQVLVATSDTSAEWADATGSVEGPPTSLSGNLAVWGDTLGSELVDGSVQISDVIIEGDARLTNPRTPSAHKTTHQNGGADELDVTGLSGVLADPQNPTSHKASHKHGGSDEIASASPIANGIPKAGADGKLDTTWLSTGTGATDLILGGDARLTDVRTPSAHASSHQNGGSDEINVGGLSGVLADPQTPATHKTVHQNGGADEINVSGLSGVLADPQTPASHATTHENGGADEISVAGLSGVLADAQVADKIKTSGTAVTISSTAPSAGQVLKATSSTAASWQTIPAGGDVVGTSVPSVTGNLPIYTDTTGKNIGDSGVQYSDVILAGDPALTNARTPTAHATSHKHGGADEIATTTAAANAIPKAGAGGTLGITWLPTGTTSSTLCVGDDARLTNSRNPTAHKTSHQSGGSDEISLAGLSGRAASSQTADQIATSGTAVTISSTAPSVGQVLQATSATGAAWTAKSVEISSEVSGLGSGVATFLTTPSSANLRAALTDETGGGAAVFADSPTLTTPNLGTPSAVNLTNGTNLPISTGVGGLGSGVATFLTTPSSANLKTAVTDETGSGSLVFATSPTLVSPVLGTVASGNISSCTGRVSSNQTADQIATSGTPVSIATGAPSAGQVLQATSPTAAQWSTLSVNPYPSTFTATSATTLTASVNTAYLATPPAGHTTITLPSTHSAGDWIAIHQIWGSGDVKVTIPSGHTLAGVNPSSPTTYTLSNTYSGSAGRVILLSTSSTNWIIWAGALN